MARSAGSTDVQHFNHDGRWVKPAGAVRVDVTLMGGCGGAATRIATDCSEAEPEPEPVRESTPGETGEVVTRAFLAADLPGEMSVSVGRGGFATVVSHLMAGENNRQAN